jgi:translation initiation factor 1
MSKKRLSRDGIVYSTDPDFTPGQENVEPEETLSPRLQKLRIRLDTKQRGGKAVTLIEGFSGREADIQDLGKALKGYCGTGGAVKSGEILIQGDQRDKVLQWLLKNGYSGTKKV